MKNDRVIVLDKRAIIRLLDNQWFTNIFEFENYRMSVNEKYTEVSSAIRIFEYTGFNTNSIFAMFGAGMF